MNYVEYLELLDERRKICIFGAGLLGRGEGYLFMKNMLGERGGGKIAFFCDNHLSAGTEIVDGIKTVEPAYLYAHSNEVVCMIMANGKSQYEIKDQLESHNLKTYTLDEYHIFRLCNEILRIGNALHVSRVKKFFGERQYEVQIETSSFCNAQCSFCPNVSLKRRKSIMSEEVFAKVVERIKTEKIQVSTFILHLNGEPLTDHLIFDRTKLLKTEFPNARVRFTTNFALASAEMTEKLIESGLDEITCSLNATDEKKYRQIMGLDYAKTITNIERLLKRKQESGSDLDISLSAVVADGDESQIDQFREQWNGINVRVMKLGRWVDEQADSHISDRERSGICPILYRTINILSNGDYALCCFDAEGIIHYNVMDSSIEEAWGSQMFREIREWHLDHGRTNKECVNCSF